MNAHRLTLELRPEAYAVARLDPADGLPSWALAEPDAFVAMVRADDELSVVCRADLIPFGVRAEPGWRLLRLEGPMDMDLVGVLASITAPLASAGVPVFVVSTFDTDYLLVRDEQVLRAVAALSSAGHAIRDRSGES